MPVSPKAYCKKIISRYNRVFIIPKLKDFHQASNFLVRSSLEGRLNILGMLFYRKRIPYMIQDIDICLKNIFECLYH